MTSEEKETLKELLKKEYYECNSLVHRVTGVKDLINVDRSIQTFLEKLTKER